MIFSVSSPLLVGRGFAVIGSRSRSSCICWISGVGLERDYSLLLSYWDFLASICWFLLVCWPPPTSNSPVPVCKYPSNLPHSPSPPTTPSPTPKVQAPDSPSSLSHSRNDQCTILTSRARHGRQASLLTFSTAKRTRVVWVTDFLFRVTRCTIGERGATLVDCSWLL